MKIRIINKGILAVIILVCVTLTFFLPNEYVYKKNIFNPQIETYGIKEVVHIEDILLIKGTCLKENDITANIEKRGSINTIVIQSTKNIEYCLAKDFEIIANEIYENLKNSTLKNENINIFNKYNQEYYKVNIIYKKKIVYPLIVIVIFMYFYGRKILLIEK